METKKSGFATAGLVLGIIAICTSFIPIINNASFVLGVLAVIFGLIALSKKAGRGKVITAIILGILSVVITLSLQDSWSESIDDMTGGNTEKVLKNVDVNIGDFTVTTDKYGFTDTKLVVKITNKTNKITSFDFTIEAVDKDGSRIDTDFIYASNLGAGQSQSFNLFEFVSDENLQAMKSATFKVVEASMY